MGFHRNVMDVRRYSLPVWPVSRVADKTKRYVSPSLRPALKPSSSNAEGVRWPAAVRSFAALSDGGQKAVGAFSPRTLRPVIVENTGGAPSISETPSKKNAAYHQSNSGPNFPGTSGWGRPPPSRAADTSRAPGARPLYLKPSVAPRPSGLLISPDKLYRASGFFTPLQPGYDRKIGSGAETAPALGTASPPRTAQSGLQENAARPSQYRSYLGSSDDRRLSRSGFNKATYQHARSMDQRPNDGDGGIGKRSGWPGVEATPLAAVSAGEHEDGAKRSLRLDESSTGNQDGITQSRLLAGEIWLDSVSLRDWFQTSIRDSEFRAT